jgi:hypothetical protein
VLFFEADTGGRQIRGIDQSHRPRLPQTSLQQWGQQMVVDASQSTHTYATAKFVQDAHARHLGLAAQTGKLSPRALFGKHSHQQVYRMHRCQQTQQMDPIELCRAVIAPSPAGMARLPALVDEIIGHERI